MLNLLKYEGEIVVNGVTYRSSDEAYADVVSKGTEEVEVFIPGESSKPEISVVYRQDCEYLIRVKHWMLEKSSPAFDFMQKWNDDVAMPLSVMQGYVLDETDGMVKMSLEGVLVRTVKCSVCGRALKNELSQQYGIGPECASKIGLERVPKSDAELDDMFAEMEQHLRTIQWEGWIAKSAIVDKLVIE